MTLWLFDIFISAPEVQPETPVAIKNRMNNLLGSVIVLFPYILVLTTELWGEQRFLLRVPHERIVSCQFFNAAPIFVFFKLHKSLIEH